MVVDETALGEPMFMLDCMNVVVMCPICKQETEVHLCVVESERNERLFCRRCEGRFSVMEIGGQDHGNN